MHTSRQTILQAARRHTAWRWGALGGLGAAVCAALLTPAFLTFDSYWYLAQSLRPVAGHGHPMGFALLLSGLARLADRLGPTHFGTLLVFYNALCVATLACVVGRLAWSWYAAIRRPIAAPHACGLALVMALGLPWVVLGCWFLINAVWTECTALGQLGLLVGVAAAIRRRWRTPVVCFGAAVAVWAYHTRVQLALLPLAFVAVGAVLGARRLAGRPVDADGAWRRFVATGVVMLLAIAASTQAEAHMWPRTQSAARQAVAHAMLLKAMACTLGCQAQLFEVDCTTAAGRQRVEAATCYDVIVGTHDLGRARVSLKTSTLDLLAQVGAKTVLRWLAAAPFRYLTYRTAGTELGHFNFFQRPLPAMDPDWWPEVAGAYGQYFSRDKTAASPAFAAVHNAVARAYEDWRIYNALGGLLVLAALVLIAASRQPVVLLLCIYTVATYLVFALIQPLLPLRYLLQFIVPGFAGVLLGTIERTAWQCTQEKRASKRALGYAPASRGLAARLSKTP